MTMLLARKLVPMSVGEIGTVREHLERYRAVTFQSLERTPSDKLSWSPSPGLMTFAGQYAHLAGVERLYVQGLSGAGWSAQANTLDGPADIDQLRAALLDARAITTTWLDTLSPSALDGTVVVPWLPVQWSLRSWLWYLVEHEMHHKGQIALYLHMCGIEAPFFAFVLPPGARPDKRPFVPPSTTGTSA
jgi:uncharacterized damage-inducible protein DinB